MYSHGNNNIRISQSPVKKRYLRRKAAERSGDTQFGTKQKVIHDLHNKLKSQFHKVLMDKDSKGANSVRIQAKNKSTLQRLERSLFDLQVSIGRFEGIRITMAVQKGSLKKGINVLIQFKTVREAFRAITFMKDLGFKAQTVIPRRLREQYGMTVDGEDVSVPVETVPITLETEEIPCINKQPPQSNTHTTTTETNHTPPPPHYNNNNNNSNFNSILEQQQQQALNNFEWQTLNADNIFPVQNQFSVNEILESLPIEPQDIGTEISEWQVVGWADGWQDVNGPAAAQFDVPISASGYY